MEELGIIIARPMLSEMQKMTQDGL
jgi:hypothetical protein